MPKPWRTRSIIAPNESASTLVAILKPTSAAHWSMILRKPCLGLGSTSCCWARVAKLTGLSHAKPVLGGPTSTRLSIITGTMRRVCSGSRS
ncbi:hypothetical protein D3C80_1809110 [compost metagenome]